jgi:hypothetical protein
VSQVGGLARVWRLVGSPAAGRLLGCTLCSNFVRTLSLFTLASSPVRRFISPSLPACARRKKSLYPPRPSKWPAQRATFERASGELPGGAVEQKLGTLPDDRCAPGGLSDCTLCTNLIRPARYSPSRLLTSAVSFILYYLFS